MIDIKLIREKPDLVKQGVQKKGYDAGLVDEVIRLDKSYREMLGKIETLRARRNKLTKDQVKEGKEIKDQLKKLETEASDVKDNLDENLNRVPNPPLDSVPMGEGEKDNVEIRRWGTPGQFDFKPKDHLELGKTLNILDFEAGAKVSGSQFYFLYNEGALLELALVQYALTLLAAEGFMPVITPDLAKARFYLGTGYSPKG